MGDLQITLAVVAVMSIPLWVMLLWPRKPELSESEQNAQDIANCRQAFGPAPRRLGEADARTFRLTLGGPVEAAFRMMNDKMVVILDEQDCLRDRGRVVWGQLVQANSALFDPSNRQALPANLIYSLDPSFDAKLGDLRRLAEDLGDQKGREAGLPEMVEFVRIITDERERLMRRELPRCFAGDRKVFFGTFFVQPQHLPRFFLERGFFPLVVNPEETEAVMILPARYWPADLKNRWCRT